MQPNPQATQSESTHLADEANHRIANHLAMLAGLMRLRAKGFAKTPGDVRADDVRLIFEEFAGRLETVGEVHRLLAKGSSGAAFIDIAAYLPRIAVGLASSLTAPGQTTVHCSFPVVWPLPADQAVSLGLIIGELVTNAVKYAHPAGVAGIVRIEAWHADDGMLTIEACDDGVGLPDDIDPQTSQSLGFRTIRLLAQQLGANVSFDNTGLGLSCALQIPRPTCFLKAAS